MKTREEQIEEMAKDLEQAKYWAMGTVGSLNSGFGGWYGTYMYNQGYRKQSDIVREFVEKIDEVAVQMRYEASRVYWGRNSRKQFAFGEESAIVNLMAQIYELAKEYEAEVEE